MKVKISLARIRGTEQYQPFWFTNQRSIHMNGNNPSIEIDPAEYSFHDLVQIENANRAGLIDIVNRGELLKEIKKKNPEKQEIEGINEAIDIEENTIDAEIVEEIIEPKKTPEDLKKDAFDKEANRLSDLSVKNFKKEVGGAALSENNELSKGIGDIALLEKVIELEASKEEPRKSIADIASERIEAIKQSNKVVLTEEENLGTIE